MVKVEETAPEAQEEPVLDEKEEAANELKQRLLEAGMPQGAIDTIPEWKKRHGAIQVAWLSFGPCVYRKLLWSDLRSVANSMNNLSKSPNASETNIPMLQLELQLEKAVLYPVINTQTASRFPSGDLEALQELINEFSGYSVIPPAVDDL